MSHKPSPILGALIGGLLIVPLIVITALANQLAGLPFFPFDMIDWLARTLPGTLIINTIQVMVSIIRGLGLGPTDEVAKIAEQIMGGATLIALGVLAGGVFFAVKNALSNERARGVAGILLGVVVAVPIALIVASNGSADLLTAGVWSVFAFGVWGISLNMIHERLAARQATVTTVPAAASSSAAVVDRRQFLIQLGAATATITVVGGGLSALLNTSASGGASSLPVPEATLDPELASSLPVSRGSFAAAPGTRPEITALADHYRIDIRATPLEIAEEGYTLPFTSQIGGVQRTVAELTLDEIRAYEAVEDYITMSCISNPVGGDLISTIKWTGVPMQDILAGMDIPEGATHLKIMAGDNFDETVALDTILNDRRVMLCYAWDDQPLNAKHGFPLRIHIPNLYGMKQPKWIVSMEFLDADEDGYWVRRGWDKEAIVRATSVIDTVALDHVTALDDGTQIVPIGGIAWAGDRSVERVQVRVDGGEWQEATVNAAISERTWQLWRYDWAFVEGYHQLEVRCIEPDRTPQLESDRGTFPSGATGLHSVTENFPAQPSV